MAMVNDAGGGGGGNNGNGYDYENDVDGERKKFFPKQQKTSVRHARG